MLTFFHPFKTVIMKNLMVGARLSLLFLLTYSSVYAQKNLNLGLGYFGETATHPGLVAHLEVEKSQSKKVSTLFRTDVGAYVHARNHVGAFVDVHAGLRRYRPSGIFTEQYLGLGTMLSFLNGDGVFQRDENGNIRRASSFANLDIMPSVTLGIGYNFSQDSGSANLLYLRPKVFWQLPFNNLALPHFALQVGFIHRIN